MNNNNQERTKKYLENFNREKTIKYLNKEDHPVIFDVGANNGLSAIEFKEWWPKAIIHCFEPQEECWVDLDKLEKEYNDSSIILNKCAIGNNTKNNATFYTHDLTTGQSGFHKISTESKDSINLNELKEKKDVNDLKKYNDLLNHVRNVEIIRLDHYMEEKNIVDVNILKIDTQGHEPEVLEGLGGKLSHVGIIITELMFYDYYERSLSFSDIEKYLIPAGFKLDDISHISKNPMNGRTDWVDAIYINDQIIK